MVSRIASMPAQAWATISRTRSTRFDCSAMKEPLREPATAYPMPPNVCRSAAATARERVAPTTTATRLPSAAAAELDDGSCRSPKQQNASHEKDASNEKQWLERTDQTRVSGSKRNVGMGSLLIARSARVVVGAAAIQAPVHGDELGCVGGGRGSWQRDADQDENRADDSHAQSSNVFALPGAKRTREGSRLS